MKKSHIKISNKKSYKKSKLSKFIIIGTTILTLAIFLGYTLKNNCSLFFQIPSINYENVEDPSLAREPVEKQAMEKLNEAAKQESRARTPKQKEDAVTKVLVASKVVSNLSTLKTIPPATTLSALETQATQQLIDAKKIDSVTKKPIITPATTVITPPITNPSGDCTKGYFFGCSYPPGFFYKGDEGCGSSSVAGYYCWKDATTGEYKLYVINLPDTKRAENKLLVATQSNLDSLTAETLNTIKSQKGTTIAEKLENYLKSQGIHDSNNLKNLTERYNNQISEKLSSDLENKPTDEQIDQDAIDDAKRKQEGEAATKAQIELEKKIFSTSYNAQVRNAKSQCDDDAKKITGGGRCIPVQGGGYAVVRKDSNITSVSYNTGALVGRPSSLNTDYKSIGDCQKISLSVADEECKPFTTTGSFGSQTVYRIVAKDTAERKTYLKWQFGPATTTSTGVTTSPTVYINVGKECPKSYMSCDGFCDTNSEGRFASKPVGGKIVCDVPPPVRVDETNTLPITNDPNLKRVGQECPKDYLGCSGFCDTNSEGRFASKPVGGKIVCDVPPAPTQVSVPVKVKGTIPSGNKCASYNNNDSCVSGDCRVMRTDAGFGSWCYSPGLKSSDYVKTPVKGTIPSGNKCASYNNNDSCVSGDCRVIRTDAGFGSWCYSPGLKSSDYVKTPTISTPAEQSSLTPTTQLAQISAPIVDTGQQVAPVVDVPPPPAVQSAVNVPVVGVSSDPPIGLTNKGSGPCRRIGNSYCDGNRMYEVYSWYRDNKGWWNKDGSKLTPAKFMAMMLVVESGGNAKLLDAITVATSNQLWGRAEGGRVPYCNSQIDCQAGVLNFTGAYMQSAGMRYNNLLNSGRPEDPSTWETYYNQLAKSGTTLDAIANKTVITQSPKIIDLNTPTDWGAAKSDAGSDPDVVNRNENCSVYYEGGGDIVYSFEQKRQWDSGNCL